MNFLICSLLLLFLRRIFTISSANGIPARLQMLFELAIILVIVLVCQSLSARLICEGMNLIDRRSLMREATSRGVDMFGTRAMIFELALLAVKYFLVAIALFLVLPGCKLVAETLLNIVDLVQSIGVWFPKKKRKPPDKNKSQTQQINLIVALILLWLSNYGKRGRIAPCGNQRPAAAASRDAAPGHFFPVGGAYGRRSRKRPRPTLTAAPLANAHGSARGPRSWKRPRPALMAAPVASTHGSARGGTTPAVSGGTHFPAAAAIKCAARENQHHVQSCSPLQDSLTSNSNNFMLRFRQAFSIHQCHSPFIHLSNVFDAAAGPHSDADSHAYVGGDHNALVACSHSETSFTATEQIGPQFIANNAGFRGSALMVPAFWPRSFGFQHSRLGSFGCRSFRLDAMNPFEFVGATPLLHRRGLAGKAINLMMVLFLVKNVYEGDVSRYFCSARNTVASEFICASNLQLECSCDSCNRNPTVCSPGKSVSETMLINWYEKLKRSLQIRDFCESVADPCVFIKNGTTHDEDVNVSPPGKSGSETMQKLSSDQSPQLGSPGDDDKSIVEQFRKSSGSVIVLTFVYDCIILERDRKTITKFIATLKYGPEKFDFTDEGTISKCLQRLPSDSGLTMSQPFLSKHVLASCDQNPQLGSPVNDSGSKTMWKHSFETENEAFPAAPTQTPAFPAAPAQTAAFPAAFTGATSAGFTLLNVFFKPTETQFLLATRHFLLADNSLAIAAGEPAAKMQFELPLTLILLSFFNHCKRGPATASATITDGSHCYSTYSHIHSQSVQYAEVGRSYLNYFGLNLRFQSDNVFRGRAVIAPSAKEACDLVSISVLRWPTPIALPFARECEDIWGLPNSLQNSPRGNLYVSEHARSKCGKCAYKYQTRALRKSESVLRLRMWLSRKTAAQRSSLTFRTLAIRSEYQSVVDNDRDGDDDGRDYDGSASLAASSAAHDK